LLLAMLIAWLLLAPVAVKASLKIAVEQ
jgi:hypothetical protein